MRRIPIITIALILTSLLLSSRTMHGQVRLTDASDRAALRSWFVLLADAQFYRATPDVTDCAALIRHALREALRPHTPEWRRTMALPGAPVYADVRVKTPLNEGGGLAMFRVNAGPVAAYQEFADAKTIVKLNTRPIGRDVAALRPGDLIYFHQPSQNAPDHLMVFVGSSPFESEGRDWVVYHTGPDTSPAAAGAAAGPGEVRKVRLRDLMRHPAARWRPVAGNPQFVGVFRLDLL